MTPQVRFVALDEAAPDDAVVVIDVLRAFTVAPWLFARGAQRVLAVGTAERAFELRDHLGDGTLLAGESGGERIDGFDLGNSPAEVAATDLRGRLVVHRTSAGTQGLMRTSGSRLVFAASFVTAGGTARALRAAAASKVTFVITGASLGRDGDEDLACAELIAARIRGEDPDPAPFLARIATSDAGRNFVPGGPAWASLEDLAMTTELDRFDDALVAVAADEDDAIELTVASSPTVAS